MRYYDVAQKGIFLCTGRRGFCKIEGRQYMGAYNRITIADVADALGVSKTTVSRAISGKGRIGSATKERIFAYISEHDYVPSTPARGLAQSRTYNIGITVPEEFALVDLPFFKKCLMGVCGYAGTADYDVVVSMTSINDISQLERMVNNHKVDGVILSRTLVKDAPAEFLKSKNVPFVTIGSSDDPDIVQVDNDHEAACRELTNILILQGIGRIVLLCGDPRHVVTQKRLSGFRQALKDRNITETADMIRYDADGVYADRIIDDVLSKQYDCILCMDDAICEKVLDKLKKENIGIPDRVKIASFYNSSVLERNTPAVTSLQFDAQELGRVACHELLDIIEGREVPHKTLLGYEISMKESTKMVRN